MLNYSGHLVKIKISPVTMELPMSVDKQKMQAAEEASKLIHDGMTVGLGTGSTVAHLLAILQGKLRELRNVRWVATSEDTARKCAEMGISTDSDLETPLDLDIDGADEADLEGNLIKGGGGALLREKIVARNSRNVIIIVDSGKLKKDGIGDFGIPVAISPHLMTLTLRNLEELGGKCTLRGNGNYRTDDGNAIADCHFGKVKHPELLEARIKLIPGVVEVGIFHNLCDMLIVGVDSGTEKYQFKRRGPSFLK